MAQASPTNAALLANFASRVLLAFIGILINQVPLQLLIRNGEFAAVVFIVDVAIMNLTTIVNSFIWRDDDWSTWWDGAGLCDIEVYLSAPLQTIYASSIFAVMYHLAQQVKVTGAARDQSERTRRNLIQAAIIFPIPLVQLVFTHFDLAQRYIIGTLIGCSAVYDVSWPKTLVFDAPPAVFAVLSVPYAVLLWRRYRALTKQAQGMLKSGSEASIRANRTRRRLYNMCISILVVYVPVMMYFLVYNIKDTLSSYKAYDYHRMHWSATPYPWETILFVPSWIIPSVVMNQPWIPIATSFVILSFFGMTMEARQTYRQIAEYIGLGSCFRKFKRRKDQASSSADESGRTRESRKMLLPSHAKDAIEYGQNPHCEISVMGAVAENDCTQHSADHPTTILVSASQLRLPHPNTPINQENRPAPLTAQPRRKRRRTGTSDKSTGSLTRFGRDASTPMLPLHNMWRRGRGETDSRRALGSFLARDVRETVSRVESERPASRPESVQVRIPIMHRRSAPYGCGADSLGIRRVRETQRASFPREQTLASLYTASEARTDKSCSSAGRDVSGKIGVAK
ncbi:hypothetical protein NUW58_g4955 [Xylaria curta]|uniref:Uncharacterized protein n=1 Tax=Xylaria curta TaxID=42375 RepID=A0ACC1P6R5_9PEZI|nr:hypothetical protein NUW58_g4955 [Xylaria curta]